MGEQQSQKEGMKSSAQKEAGTRDPNAPLPASNAVGGAFGKERGRTSEKEPLTPPQSAESDKLD
jgi:hypothetical protein